MEFKVENFQDMFFIVLLSRGTIFSGQYYGEFKRSSEIRLLQEIYTVERLRKLGQYCISVKMFLYRQIMATRTRVMASSS